MARARELIPNYEQIYRGHPDPEPFYMEGNEVGVLLVHGYTGSPPEMRPIADYLHQRGGYTVSGPLLPGHGTRPQDLQGIRWRQWANAVNYHYRNLAAHCQQVFIGGLSMGGVLSLHQAEALADEPNRKLAGVIALSTPMYVTHWLAPLAPIVKHVVRWRGNHQSMEQKVGVLNKGAVKDVWAYLRTPSHADHQVLLLIKQTRYRLAAVDEPILIIQSRLDPTAPPPSAEIIYNRVSSTDKQLIWLENSSHVITVDNERARVIQAVYDFINARAA